MKESTYKDAFDGSSISGMQHVPGPLRICLILLLIATRVLTQKSMITPGRKHEKINSIDVLTSSEPVIFLKKLVLPTPCPPSKTKLNSKFCSISYFFSRTSCSSIALICCKFWLKLMF